MLSTDLARYRRAPIEFIRIFPGKISLQRLFRSISVRGTAHEDVIARRGIPPITPANPREPVTCSLELSRIPDLSAVYRYKHLAHQAVSTPRKSPDGMPSLG